MLYGVSHNTRAWWDLAPGRALGYDPQDNAEDWAAQVEPRPEDAAENAHVGGNFLEESMERPALDQVVDAGLDFECTPPLTLAG